MLGIISVLGAPAIAQEPHAGEIRFDRDVKPILAHHCFKCHARGRSKGGLHMDDRERFLLGGDSGAVVKVGDAARSRLIELVSGADPELTMPPEDDGNKPLSADQIAILRRWIDQGLNWTDERIVRHYALALQPVTTPPGEGNPIDRLLESYFAQAGIRPAPPVDDRRFARRVYLDLVGLLPAPEELETFIRDRDPGKRERLVRRLLDDHEAFVGHSMPFWMDHLRIGSSLAASIFDNDKSAKPLQWLESQLQSGSAYDQFVREFVAGPIFEDYAQSIAPRDEVANAQGRPEMQIAQVVGQTFLGVRIQCASCHDSFVDRWTLRESWGLASALGGESFEMARCEIPTGERAQPAFLFPELGTIAEDLPANGRRARLAALMTSPQNGLFARTLVNRVWARLFGRGLLEPLDEMVEHESWHPDLLDWLAGEFVRQNFDIKRLLALIVTSRAYQQPTDIAAAKQLNATNSNGDAQSKFVFRGPQPRRLTAEQFIDAILALNPTKTNPRISSSARAWRLKNDALMKSLGRPDRNTVVTSRASDFNVLQTLEWMNGERLEHLLQTSACGIVTRVHESPEALVTRVCRALLGRAPAPAEAEEMVRLVGPRPTEASVADLLWVVLMLPEFQFVP